MSGLTPEEIRQREEWQRQGMFASLDGFFAQFNEQQERERRRPVEADVPVEARIVAEAEVVKAPQTRPAQAKQVVDAQTVAAVEEALTPTPERLAAALEMLRAFCIKYVHLPSPQAYDGMTLWVAHTYIFDVFDATPRIFFTAKERETGKTRALEVLETVAANPITASSVSSAYLFRRVEKERPTVLLDEVDTIFGPKAKPDEGLRGLLNAGYRRSGRVGRVVGEGANMTTKDFSAFTPVAFAGEGTLPETLASRTIHVRMRRRHRRKGENVAYFREKRARAEEPRIADELAPLLMSCRDQLAEAEPEMPHEVSDRAQDIWEPLTAIADLAGEDWGQRIRTACIRMSPDSEDVEESIGTRLLRDLWLLWKADEDFIPTKTLLDRLHSKLEAPWATLSHGESINQNWLGGQLKGYEIQSCQRRNQPGENPVRGYVRSDLLDPWSRYVPEASEALHPVFPPPPRPLQP